MSQTEGPRRRIRLDLGYRGTDFHGWARQPEARTVQGLIEAGLETICGTPVRTVVAGRTDAGVHARRQVVHLDITDAIADRLIGRSDRTAGDALAARLRGALRHLGADDIVIHAAAEVDASFDARFAAVSRRYTYRIADPHSFLDPLAAGHTTVSKEALDAAAMHTAAQEIIGLHDFLPFCKPRPESTTIRTLLDCTVTRDDADIIVIDLRADAFCHHMVRALVGGLMKVGTGAWPVTRPAELIARAEAGSTDLGPMFVTPAHGLVMEHVEYPPPREWQARAERTRARRDAESAAD
ncbi:tRNA pseudouridine(38-40) synthase TruA [Brevibacterium luteolum]|uniref:tRNA pseudouridine(38-40) synthase TruA n=1 Tax=Brevibacterium luteolum TaxID=199591 RepID=UPI0021AE84BB|nr:tRNA pseudouridine(38-40) synthase TruA [Brevibacterium luteolum]MCT1872910.1 tRNA pseudouridine(38-40) synthase TruA [Brevibacterium luteolum]MCT1890943.1 tRNA pseudouridine(38-40) synthase TruA [Brevibacterium luteolum]MCT1893489.1 tRNA pseudouridine(38-40) synthase TruA [Brevibacterium luteolum]MCT1924259.1 tRNA pseudouridine(38-40) synthase TruA [Brevibacterium luteolum]